MATPETGWTGRHLRAALLVGWACCGCGEADAVRDPTIVTLAPPSDNSPVRRQLDEVLDATYDRRLNLQDHAAWQVLHGALAFGTSFLVEREPGGERVPAVEHLLAGGDLQGWSTEPGIVLDEAEGRRGLRVRLESGSQIGQGHHDQWLAVLSQCELAPTQEICAHDRAFAMEDLVRQVQWDVPRNLEREFSWTLIGLTAYLPTHAEWVASDGDTWSIERLMESELEQDLATSPCGGTHRLIGISMSLNRHLAQSGKLEGVWQKADQTIQQAIGAARQYQNPDGSFSSHYFQRPGSSPDLAQDLGTTGHVLEFLTIAMTDQQLDEDWVRRAVIHMCDLLRLTSDMALECGALYHAAHGLVLYRQRVFGFRPHP